jgi:hypothetical protein
MNIKDRLDKYIEDKRGITLAFLSFFIAILAIFLANFAFYYLIRIMISLFDMRDFLNSHLEWIYSINNGIFYTIIMAIPLFTIAYAIKRKGWIFIVYYVCLYILLAIFIIGLYLVIT